MLNAQITLNAYTSAGTTYDNLDSTQQTYLTKLGVESGLGASFFETVLKVSAGKEILTTIKSDDDTKVSVIYKDGSTTIIPTGLKGKVTGGGTDTSLKTAVNELLSEMNKYTGSDGYVSPETYNAARKQWADNNLNVKDFDSNFSGYKNPNQSGYVTDKTAGRSI